MKDRPILFSAPMVRAILAGTKTQTRRIIQPAGTVKVHNGLAYTDRWDEAEGHGWRRDVRCPYGVPGDHLWVREAWSWIGEHHFEDHGSIQWAADWGVPETPARPRPRWKPSIHMPRWASRILLEVIEVRAQRVQAITYDDIIAEGVEPQVRIAVGKGQSRWSNSRYEAFEYLWNQINGAGSWEENPWVWAITFRRLKP